MAETQEAAAKPPIVEEATATPTPEAGADATEPGGVKLNVEAPEFKPRAADDDEDLLSKLPPPHRARLRNFYQAYNGECVAYYLGRLKTFNNKTGYGFLECKQCKKDWGGDVFIHKNNIPIPWNIGQPVEFAVNCNNRGQPQAFDCNWLPRLPQPQQQQALAPAAGPSPPPGLPVAGGAGAGYAGAPAAKKAEASQEVESNEPRRFGTVKSFSQTTGFGFVACEEIQQVYQRDVYLDKSNIPQNWRVGQFVEFSVTFNNRSQPQAKRVNWEPVPLTVIAEPPSWKRTFTQKTIDQLKRLSRLLHEKNVETAVVTAIDLQGGSGAQATEKSEEQDSEVDYVFFVLDRLGNKEEVLKNIKDFVKMLIVLMLSKMLRTQLQRERTVQIISWYEAVAQNIDTTSDAVKQHFQDVLAQINNHLKHAATDNQHLADQALSQPLHSAFALLKDKSRTVA
mmetsp:Transcript_81448/g.143840  ORF Transcript_81448/g.143840 Transcript_81448/m.143840 type:complete len:452 (+) Transcript_81448:93-1448(+)|eukprot:CAMPEP_0197638670 /NCGR_PEP_ID=MMETSP1338-20131121/13541_1 /TAXON_ID=43686 ORGANISM="Pelagodinium beii, Strain RCC1491" /NCGR_SAMPLE_ID=MMETSP1338 /ASSEMBLY_ACC=CAM_ASM_000754 /LENGTH=451 /DNA_ID=CAMNT_0043211293 /DNA_START=90 /DNA_END=1445 /DNA_ORIENTATION=-